jgi:hypothetical protein
MVVVVLLIADAHPALHRHTALSGQPHVDRQIYRPDWLALQPLPSMTFQPQAMTMGKFGIYGSFPTKKFSRARGSRHIQLRTRKYID